jgi:hypothetical protein
MARRAFGSNPQYVSPMFNLANQHLYKRFNNKISGTSVSQFTTKYVGGELVNERWIALN